ncbi:MAG: hypothetical protein R3Y67_10550 [Eubacteriales bacterium]
MTMRRLRAALVATMMMAMAVSSVATAGDGEGGGDSALSVEVVNFEDEGNIAVGESLEFEASNNICNSSVKDNNYTCISVTDADGGAVDYEVVLYDDQLEAERKADITVNITGAVEGTTYKVIFSEDLTSKNGNSLGSEQVFTVTVGNPSSSMTMVIVAVIAIIVIVGVGIVATKKKKA